jgi:hypothetical protein
MNLPRKRLEWHGGPTETVGYSSLPVMVWVLDEWFQRAHPHWEWWHRMWMRILPNWGDPFCAAYCFVFSVWVMQHDRRES